MPIKRVRVRTADAQRALRDEIRDTVQDASLHNELVSLTEQEQLPAFIQDAANALRAEKGSGATITIDEVVDRATSSALSAWEEFNPAGNGRDSAYLSKAEIAQISSKDAALGELTSKAYNHISLRAAQGTFHGYGLEGSAKKRVEKYGFLRMRDVATRMADDTHRTTLPGALLESYDLYFREVEEAGKGQVYVDNQSMLHDDDAQDLHILFVLSNDGSGYVETFSEAGEPLASGRLEIGADGDVDVKAWDATFGQVRADLD
jgi:hypothetical protein